MTNKEIMCPRHSILMSENDDKWYCPFTSCKIIVRKKPNLSNVEIELQQTKDELKRVQIQAQSDEARFNYELNSLNKTVRQQADALAYAEATLTGVPPRSQQRREPEIIVTDRPRQVLITDGVYRIDITKLVRNIQSMSTPYGDVQTRVELSKTTSYHSMAQMPPSVYGPGASSIVTTSMLKTLKDTP